MSYELWAFFIQQKLRRANGHKAIHKNAYYDTGRGYYDTDLRGCLVYQLGQQAPCHRQRQIQQKRREDKRQQGEKIPNAHSDALSYRLKEWLFLYNYQRYHEQEKYLYQNIWEK